MVSVITLPEELILQIVEESKASDAAALMTSCKQMCRLGTQALYGHIQIVRTCQLRDLLRTLRANPLLPPLVKSLKAYLLPENGGEEREEFEEAARDWSLLRIPVLPNCRFLQLCARAGYSRKTSVPYAEILRWAARCSVLETLLVSFLGETRRSQNLLVREPLYPINLHYKTSRSNSPRL
jgi:hypothetical protein